MGDGHEAIMSKADPSSVDMITSVSGYDRLTLIGVWQRFFGTMPAKNISSAILIRIIAHEHQCRAYGGLNAGSKRALRKELGSTYIKQPPNAVSGLPKGGSKRNRQITTLTSQGSQSPIMAPIMAPLLAAGTQLVREWNGRPYRVEVTDGGFVLDGKNYSSLSAIAKKITGAHWSGPRFFGLATSKPKKVSGGIAGVTR